MVFFLTWTPVNKDVDEIPDDAEELDTDAEGPEEKTLLLDKFIDEKIDCESKATSMKISPG